MKTDCKFYVSRERGNKCSALNECVCVNGDCNFYKKKEQPIKHKKTDQIQRIMKVRF